MASPLDDPRTNGRDGSVSRRELLKQGAAAVGGAAILNATPALAQGQAPAVTNSNRSMAGTRFRAFVQRPGQPGAVETIVLREIQPNQVVVRVQAAQACYTIVGALVAQANPGGVAGGPPGGGPGAPPGAVSVGHGSVGIVEQIGSRVNRVQVGDRVLVAGNGACGECWLCLHGRADACTTPGTRTRQPVADATDGTPINGTGGFSEFHVAFEEWIVPINTTVPAEELSLFCDVAAVGLGMTMRRMPVEQGTDVLVIGGGPIGLSAVQGARLQGAAQVILIEPIRYRRELGAKLGATTVIDPNVDRGQNNQDLITKIRTLCKQGVERSVSGGRGPNLNNYGPMYTIEAVGGNRFPPKAEVGPDVTGVESLQLAWTICPSGGVIRTCSIGHGQGASVTFPAGQWSNAMKTHLPGNYAGVNVMRDIPQWVRLVEAGRFDAKSLVGQTFPLDRTRDALQVAADRTTITSVVTMT
ncbi:MAG: alcohol dehydrogenase catalytic domain-containing protein [Vicinamibacterales bacterium]